MATYSSIVAWKIPWKEKLGGLQCMGLQRVGHDWAHTYTCRRGITSLGCQFFILLDIAKLPYNVVIPVHPPPNSKSFQFSTNFPMFIITGIFQNYFSYLMSIKLYILDFLQFVLSWCELEHSNVYLAVVQGSSLYILPYFRQNSLKFCFPHICL